MTRISISSDGIFTFSKHNKHDYKGQTDPIHYLLLDREDEHLEGMLAKKYLILAQQFGLRPTDDIGIIRVIKCATKP